MSANADHKENRQRADALITQIKLMKLALEVKYGPQVKRYWS